jgi:pyridoxal phosphate enzyme, YggS family
MDYSFVRGRVDEIRGRIAAAAGRSGRDAAGIELLAVSKFHPIEAVAAAWEAGLRSFGESRVQEAEAKFPPFVAGHPDLRLDMIGHLQSNKAKKAALLFDRIQSVDSAELLAELDGRCRAAALRREVLLELHTGEESKEGFSDEEDLYRALELLLSSPERAIEPRGLMTMAPNGADEVEVRRSCAALRKAREGALARFGSALGGRFDVLSMGMSGDYELAIEEGSTLVRIGTAIFGARGASPVAAIGGQT